MSSNLTIFTCFFFFFFSRLSGSTAIGTSGNGNGGGNGNAGGSGGSGSAGNGTSGGDFLRRSHPLSEHTALHPAYRINYMDHIYHQLQASTHSPNASLHGNYPDTRIKVDPYDLSPLHLSSLLFSFSMNYIGSRKRGPHFRRKSLF